MYKKILILLGIIYFSWQTADAMSMNSHFVAVLSGAVTVYFAVRAAIIRERNDI